MSETESFSLGLTYWPRRAGFGWWRAFDLAESREDLAHIAALGCDTLRFCLRWEDFQPGARRINSGALRSLESALDAAHDAGLRVVAALFPVAIGGALQLPSWANGIDPLAELRRTARFGAPLAVPPANRPPLLYDDGYHANQARDLFSEPELLAAQRYLVREVAGYFGQHPALWAWQLGEGFERVSKPASADAVHEWFAAIGEALREQRHDAQLIGVASAWGLRRPAGPRPDRLAAACDLLGVAADPLERMPGARPPYSAYVRFLHALAAELGRAPALATSLGMATAPDGRGGWAADESYGRSALSYWGHPDEQAEFVGAALAGLHRAGARGAWLAAYADYAPALWRIPPLDRAVRERTLGLVDAEGREKPAAAAVRAFAAGLRASGQAAPNSGGPTLGVDPERYWRDPKRSFEALWREFAENAD